MKVYLETYGCTANKSDASLMCGLLKEKNHELVDTMDDADVLVLVTCTVIGTTEQRMLSRLKCFKQKHKPIIAAGCMASVQADLIRSVVPDAKLLPPRYSHHLVDVVEEKKVRFTERHKTRLPKWFNDVTAPILIAEGCDSACSYCITQLARGQITSYPTEAIKHDIRFALEQGCKEIQITAQDTASYGLDTGANLGYLLSEICTIDSAFRIRVGMMNPFTALQQLGNIIDAYGDQKIYKFVHLPVQSGDDAILNLMNRRYTSTDFLDIIKKFRRAYPDITLSTDVIVGFPTETEEQFDHTVELVKKTKPDIVNITRYSPRPYTAAKTLRKNVPTDIAKKRSKYLSTLCSTISTEINRKYLGKTFAALVTEKGKHTTWVGRTENYKPVVLKEQVRPGSFVHVEIEDVASTFLVGKLI